MRNLISKDEFSIRSGTSAFDLPSKGIICWGCLGLGVAEAGLFSLLLLLIMSFFWYFLQEI